MVDWALALKIFIYGFGGVFISLGLLMIAVMILGFLFSPSKGAKEGRQNKEG